MPLLREIRLPPSSGAGRDEADPTAEQQVKQLACAGGRPGCHRRLRLICPARARRAPGRWTRAARAAWCALVNLPVIPSGARPFAIHDCFLPKSLSGGGFFRLFRKCSAVPRGVARAVIRRCLAVAGTTTLAGGWLAAKFFHRPATTAPDRVRRSGAPALRCNDRQFSRCARDHSRAGSALTCPRGQALQRKSDRRSWHVTPVRLITAQSASACPSRRTPPAGRQRRA